MDQMGIAVVTLPEDERDFLHDDDWSLAHALGPNRVAVSRQCLMDLKEHMADRIHRAKYYEEYPNALNEFEIIQQMINNLELNI